MNIAVIFAGGTGQRMNTATMPKQFLELHGKPILVYTLELFQHHEEIDAIVVVMLESWIDHTQKLISRYGLHKVKAVVPGGATGQESIYHGLAEAARLFGEDSVVLIHDGVRPLIDGATISDALECVRAHGSAITVSPAIETIATKVEHGEVGEIMDRSRCHMVKAPQCFHLAEILAAHKKAKAEDRAFIDSASLMQAYGYSLHTIQGPGENIKITTPSDFYVFRAIIDARENSKIFG